MAASVFIVLGDKIKEHIDEVAQEQWLVSYIGKFYLNNYLSANTQGLSHLRLSP